MRQLAIGGALGLSAAALTLLLSLSGAIETIELKTYDWRVRVVAQPDAPSDDIVMVHLDDDSIRRLDRFNRSSTTLRAATRSTNFSGSFHPLDANRLLRILRRT